MILDKQENQPCLVDIKSCEPHSEKNNLFEKTNTEDFRNYEHAPVHVKKFYYENHINQTLEYVLTVKKEIFPLRKTKITFRKLHDIIAKIIDPSDPDFIEGSQLIHNLYTAEACRILFPDEDWMHLVGFLHDYGKIIMHSDFYNLPSWSVVGDIFPVGCKFASKVVYHSFFDENPDSKNEKYNTELGIYEKNCGFDNVHFSFSHDEYMYQFLKTNCKGTHVFPEEGLRIVRYHSFYPWHQFKEYSYLANEDDLKLLPRLKEFQTADLYTKNKIFEESDLEKLLPYYESLIEKYVCKVDSEVQI